MKPKPLWVLSNWIKKKTIERLKKLLSPPHYYWYILPDKSFIICKVWLSYLTSINFLVILCLFTITHLLLCFFKYFSPNEFFSPFFFPWKLPKIPPIQQQKILHFSPPSSYFQLLLRNQWKNFNLMYYYYYSIEMYQLLINVF